MARSSKSRPRLGRGLSSLITTSSDADGAGTAPAEAQQQAEAGILGAGAGEIPIDQIASNPFQPRTSFDEAQLADLAASIVQQGVLQPLVVAPAHEEDAEHAYVLVAGERRLRAAKQAGLERVPCVVRNPERQQMIEWALVENIQRADLNPLERASAYREYIDRFRLTQADAAERLGQARATVTNHLRLLDLAEEVQEMIAGGGVTFGHAKVLAGLIGQPEPQVALAKKVVQQGLSVRELEELVAARTEQTAAPNKNRPAKSAYLRDLEDQLTRTVGTRVAIKPSKAKDRGRIVIDYYSLDDFDRIAAALGLKLES